MAEKKAWVWRPLLWWLLLVLVLFGIRSNQRMLEQTRLLFSISLNGQPLPYPVTVTWDGRPINSGDKIPLGSHRFAITGPKTDSFITNLSVWYGRHDLGDISLMRSMGALSVKADPPALSITVNGPEFSTNLQDSSGASLTVPTDLYSVSAQYRRWPDSQTVSVTEDSTMPVTFSPKFGTMHLACNRDGATFQLRDESRQIQESGSLPATVSDLPPGNYQATVLYHGRTMQKSILLQADMTNEMPFQFVLGAVQLETMPSGAQVRTTDGNYLGQTPLLLPDLTPQATQFTMSLSGYESVTVMADIAADQTNFCSTNLVGVSYLPAMRDARQYLAAANYEAAAQAAAAALNAKPDDSDALEIQSEANTHLDAKRQEQERLEKPKKWFDDLCSHYPAADLFAEHELKASKSASDAAAAIVAAFTNSPNVFKIVRTYSPEKDIYEIVAKHIGFLDASERDCLIVIGSPSDADTQIRFKVLEFEIQHHLTGDSQLIPLDQSKVQNNSLLLLQVQQGLQIVTDKIQKAVQQ
jgi:PEGA domain